MCRAVDSRHTKPKLVLTAAFFKYSLVHFFVACHCASCSSPSTTSCSSRMAKLRAKLTSSGFVHQGL